MNLTTAILHLQKDPALKTVLETTRLPDYSPSGNVYFDLLNSIVSQQLSGKAAITIFNRFCDLFPERYPHPDILAVTDHDLLRSAGLSNQKATYLRNVALYAKENEMGAHDWPNKSDKEIIDELTSIKGVGQWTVEMILIFTLGRPDIFPVDDLGIQQAMARLYSLSEQGRQLKLRMIEIAEPWRPYRSLATRYLWRWKDTV
ncbi:MAG: DNA-3-methyladenine glycosylase 2 family protein [Saprospiraceae bacterium]|nr:DNA-3-methyladenine glycosylase 2 family protein [Saprospiraceae bacterium]